MPGSFSVLVDLYEEISPPRRTELRRTLLLLLVASCAELLTVLATLPFLAIATASSGAGHGRGVITALAARLGMALGMASADPLPVAVAVLALTVVFATVVRLAVLRMSQRFVFTLGSEISAGVFSRMLRQPYASYVGRNPSEIFSGLDKIQVLINMVLMPFMQGFIAVVMAGAILVLLAILAPGITVVSGLTLAAIYLPLTLATRSRLHANGIMLAAMADERLRTLQEGHGGLRDILLENSQATFEATFNRAEQAYRQAQANNLLMATAPRLLIEGAGIILVGGIVLALRTAPGGLNAALPVLGAVVVGAQRLLPLLNQIYFGWTQYLGNNALLRDIVVLLRAPVLPSGPPARPLPFARALDLDRVTLRRPGRPDVLHDISLTITRGERIVIVGPTGGGKSSLLDLMMGIIDPSEGRVLVDGEALGGERGGERNRAWHATLAHVPQAIYLADTTIAANIAFGHESDAIDLHRVREAAWAAQLAAFIEAQPDGYDTPVGDRGIRLSGGQRQRIGIARALYKQARILFLDEATGQLDRVTEDEIFAVLAAMPRDMTVIAVSHSPHIRDHFDRVVRIDAGRIVADGPAA